MQPNIITPIPVVGHKKSSNKSLVVFWTFIEMASRYALNASQMESLIKILNEPGSDQLDLISIRGRLEQIMHLFEIEEEVFMTIYEDIHETVDARNKVALN